jgi:hypothetical protein
MAEATPSAIDQVAQNVSGALLRPYGHHIIPMGCCLRHSAFCILHSAFCIHPACNIAVRANVYSASRIC